MPSKAKQEHFVKNIQNFKISCKKISTILGGSEHHLCPSGSASVFFLKLWKPQKSNTYEQYFFHNK